MPEVHFTMEEDVVKCLKISFLYMQNPVKVTNFEFVTSTLSSKVDNRIFHTQVTDRIKNAFVEHKYLKFRYLNEYIYDWIKDLASKPYVNFD
jgi:hypothetical protein